MLKSIHLASFNGNIGDMANHIGFWNLFNKYVTSDVNVTNIEIREFYKSWGLRKFDNSFVCEVNNYDFIVIGGGNFFDIKWDYSRNGTTLDIPDSLIEKIHVPIIFNGIGVYYMKNCPTERRDKFARFIKHIGKTENKDRIIVSLRNDDSYLLLKENFSECDINNFMVIPDGGFFTNAGDYYHPEIPRNKKIIAINVAKDMIYDRWGNEESYKLFCREFADFLNISIKCNNDFHFVFVPHIPQDIEATWDILLNVNDAFRRRNITIAPYLNGTNTTGDYVIDLYRKALVTIGMRYHSNICSIAMGTPTIGIVTLNKHVELYKSIEMEGRLFDVKNGCFAEKLKDRLFFTINNIDEFYNENMKIQENLEKESIFYYEKIKAILKV